MRILHCIWVLFEYNCYHYYLEDHSQGPVLSRLDKKVGVSMRFVH
jgi:hypothetical protein